eukprot:scaffold8023_cov54-Attheya_sp.AAC.2
MRTHWNNSIHDTISQDQADDTGTRDNTGNKEEDPLPSFIIHWKWGENRLLMNDAATQISILILDVWKRMDLTSIRMI